MAQIDNYADNVIKNPVYREAFRKQAKAGLAPILKEAARIDKQTRRALLQSSQWK